METNSYLSFKLGKEEFASNVDKILHILELSKITKIPQAPYFMKGVINLRGTVLPLIDTKLRLGLEETVFTNNTCIVVLELDGDGDNFNVGILVDEVSAVLEIQDCNIEPPPSIGTKFKSNFITGVAKEDDKFIQLIDLEKVFLSDELAILKEQGESNEIKNKKSILN